MSKYWTSFRLTGKFLIQCHGHFEANRHIFCLLKNSRFTTSEYFCSYKLYALRYAWYRFISFFISLWAWQISNYERIYDNNSFNFGMHNEKLLKWICWVRKINILLACNAHSCTLRAGLTWLRGIYMILYIRLNTTV